MGLGGMGWIDAGSMGGMSGVDGVRMGCVSGVRAGGEGWRLATAFCVSSWLVFYYKMNQNIQLHYMYFTHSTIFLPGLSVIVPRRAFRRRNIDHARTDVPALATFTVRQSAVRSVLP